MHDFLADSHHKRVYLPLNRLHPPTWEKDNSPVFNNSPVTRLLVNDIGGHTRAMELIADELDKYQNEHQNEYQNEPEPNITELANAIYANLRDRYREAVSVLQRHVFPVVQCVLSRQKNHLRDVIPGVGLAVGACHRVWAYLV
jgi:hypothetical protein